MNKGIHSQEELEELRRKLYSRDSAADSIERHGLSDTPVDVSRNWDIPLARPQASIPEIVGPEMGSGQEPSAQSETISQIPPAYVPPEEKAVRPRRRYRIWILLVSLFIFIFGVGLSSLYLYMGGNQISSDNIALSIDGPFTIGGGEVMSLQIGVTNQNAVAIDSATLIVKYPPGTRSVGDAPRNLFEERIPIDSIAPGEVRNIPIQVAVFGEERVEQQISATIEYRIDGSNGTFYKDADPLSYSISSSPLLLRLESVEKVASGQTVNVKMTVISNASAPIRDILISAEYPNGFRFESAEPAPVFSDNVWRIPELVPEESTSIVLTGVVVGLTEEEFQINFNAGPAKADNPYIVGSILAESNIDFFIERPFIDVVTEINGESSRSVVLGEGQNSTVSVMITNTLDETVYDLAVEVVPGGNALSETSVDGRNGFYDSNSGTVRWEVANNRDFDIVRPGETRSLSLTVEPTNPQPTASYDLVVNVYAKRVAETSASEQLIGTARVEAKYSSEIFLGSQVGHGGVFSSSGPVPPVVGQTTTYTATIVAEAGLNDVTDTVVNTSLPLYMNWLDNTQGDGEVIYNPVSKQIEWQVGNMLSGERKELSFQLSITPSISQVGRTPVILNSQSMRATDRFTSATLQARAGAVYTELSTEAGYAEGNGTVQRAD